MSELKEYDDNVFDEDEYELTKKQKDNLKFFLRKNLDLEYAIDRKTKARINDKIRNRQVKLDVVSHYSNGENICECCYEDNLEFLTIDHIKGGGTEHRKETGWGARFYFWLKRGGFPEGYRVLCYNCNCSAKITGVCPHKLVEVEEY